MEKVEQLRFLQRGRPMDLVQNWSFFHFSFLGKIGQENAFFDTLERKNAFLSYVKKKLKKWNN